MAREGLYRMLIPRAYGGLEVAPAEMLATVEELARADGAAAWCTFIHATSGSVLAYLEPQEARELFATPETSFAGVFAPHGRAEVESDGYRVTGRWPWGSGTQNAQWILGGCVVLRDGEMELAPNGAPIPRMMLMPASEVVDFDTWHSSGLCGTGSTDFGVESLFVPSSRAVALSVDSPLDRPLYKFPNFALLGLGIAGVALGLARAAIDELTRLAAAKVPQGSRRPLAKRSHAQQEIAQGWAELRSARAFLCEAIDQAWDAALSPGPLTVTHRRDLRLATTWATRASSRVVDRMYELGGGSAVYRSSPLQRIFRDVHVTTQHMMVAPATYELTGRLLFGLETDTTFL